jgi:hypothetical protein
VQALISFSCIKGFILNYYYPIPSRIKGGKKEDNGILPIKMNNIIQYFKHNKS